MRIPGIGKLQQAVQWPRRKFGPRAIILLYHRVVELQLDPFLLTVTPQHFAEQLEVLQKHCCPISLQQLVQSLRDGNLPDRAVAVTFDDGYADNLHNAKPVLERYDIPATIFVVTGYLLQEREFWWDEIERILLQPGTLPEMVRLDISGSRWKCELGAEACLSEESYLSSIRWNILREDDPGQRHKVYRNLHQLLKPLHQEEQRQVLRKLSVLAQKESTVRSTHCTLSPQQIIALVDGGLIQIGAHTVTHPVLPSLPIDVQQSEIEQSKARLENILGSQVSSFSYPYGDYEAETISGVQETGLACACTTCSNYTWAGSDLYQLPRLGVGNWGGDEFARRLKEWFLS